MKNYQIFYVFSYNLKSYKEERRHSGAMEEDSENRWARLRFNAIVCPYCLQVGQPVVRVLLWSSRLAWTGRSYKGSSHNLLAQGRGERRKMVYADEKCKPFYAL